MSAIVDRNKMLIWELSLKSLLSLKLKFAYFPFIPFTPLLIQIKYPKCYTDLQSDFLKKVSWSADIVP